VLDLYAGTGALAIEALSRGAESAVLVESDARAAKAVRENLRITGLQDRATVFRRSVLPYLRRVGPADPVPSLVFLDPPYATPRSEVEQVLGTLAERLSDVGNWAVALTRPSRNDRIVIPVNWQAARRLIYGDSLVIVYREV
jgi:16S rRNA (guanine966-N2)-methyltransferase